MDASPSVSLHDTSIDQSPNPIVDTVMSATATLSTVVAECSLPDRAGKYARGKGMDQVADRAALNFRPP
jgi:hypothetical protein